jgi:hypothetical protein
MPAATRETRKTSQPSGKLILRWRPEFERHAERPNHPSGDLFTWDAGAGQAQLHTGILAAREDQAGRFVRVQRCANAGVLELEQHAGCDLEVKVIRGLNRGGGVGSGAFDRFFERGTRGVKTGFEVQQGFGNGFEAADIAGSRL